MSSLKSPNILCMEELSLFQLNHDWCMDRNEGLCPNGDCMYPLNMANKGITIYIFHFCIVPNYIFCCAFTIVRQLALVLELPMRNC